jgi:hypothetical protein
MGEMLVILNSADSIAAVEAVATVKQRFGDRVFIVETDRSDRLLSVAGVNLTAAGSEARAGSHGLSQTEKMGIDGWNVRQMMDDKARPGDGLNWDTPGFEAP